MNNDFKPLVFRTNGSGLWSERSAEVKVLQLSLHYTNESNTFGELRVYFDSWAWDVKTDGFIYTDKHWLKDLRKYLNENGLAGNDVSYSEYGMQGRNFVSLDVGELFIKEWNEMQAQRKGFHKEFHKE